MPETIFAGKSPDHYLLTGGRLEYIFEDLTKSKIPALKTLNVVLGDTISLCIID